MESPANSPRNVQKSPSVGTPVRQNSSEMATGTGCFRKGLPFHSIIQGSVNGEAFTIDGKGRGDSNSGTVKGKWVCTSGNLQLPWAALASTLGYGYKCFANLPNGLSHFCQEAMPEGYTQERVLRFQDDGTLKVYHEIYFQKGVIVSKVTVQGDGFKPDSHVITKNLKCWLPTEERHIPFEDGMKSVVHFVFPLKDGKGYAIATQTTVNRPLGGGRNVVQPEPYYMRADCRQYRDTDDDSDHIIHEEILEAHHLQLLEG